MATIMSNTDAQAEFGPWMEKLGQLITHAEGENWNIQ